MEMLGNILENACKYTHSKVAVTAIIDGDLIIEVADDGPGIPDSERALVLKRGARADTAQSGQGIGLSVAVDILSSYRGALIIQQSQLGGALIRIQLPTTSATKS